MVRFCYAAVLVPYLSVLAGKTAPLDSKRAAEAFNAAFSGRGSSKGVYMRATDNIDIFCGGACHNGFPDCTMSAMFWSNTVGVDAHGHLQGTVVYLSHYQAGIVFNSTLVERSLARCYYRMDGGSHERYNGGCGCIAPRDVWKKCLTNCSSPHCPYHNIGHDGHFVDGDHPDAMRCLCKSYHDENSDCFFPGPAYNTSHGRFGSSQVEEFVKSRKFFQEATEGDLNQWDEVVLDPQGLQKILDRDPAAAIQGIYFYGPKDLPTAKRLQSTIEDKYQTVLPIVQFDRSIQVSQKRGPFVAYHPSLDPPTPAPGSWQPCSAGICCNPHCHPAQNCPGGLLCQPCGSPSCQCPSPPQKLGAGNESQLVV